MHINALEQIKVLLSGLTIVCRRLRILGKCKYSSVSWHMCCNSSSTPCVPHTWSFSWGRHLSHHLCFSFSQLLVKSLRPGRLTSRALSLSSTLVTPTPMVLSWEGTMCDVFGGWWWEWLGFPNGGLEWKSPLERLVSFKADSIAAMQQQQWIDWAVRGVWSREQGKWRKLWQGLWR